MQSSLFTLNLKDFAKGATMSVFMALITALYAIIQTPGFNLFDINWAVALPSITNISFLAFISYMAKNLVSDSNGAVFGKFGGTPTTNSTAVASSDTPVTM